MGDTEDEAQAPATASDEIDPVKAAEADAWLAQFRADNAAKVMEYDYAATAATQAQATEQGARRDYDLGKADELGKISTSQRAEAATDEEKATKDAVRHDEFEVAARTAAHRADVSADLAQHFRADGSEADAASRRLNVETAEEYKIFDQARRDYEILQDQAVAAQRIATDEAKLSHPGDAAPDEPHQL